MREIKFRCYDKNEKYMLPWEHLVDAGDLSEMLKFGHEEDADYSKLMQYTGLKDKNGVEIYEGDVLIGVKTVGTSKLEVYWDKDECFFHLLRNGWPCKKLTKNNVMRSTIVGNIYENPELLETKK